MSSAVNGFLFNNGSFSGYVGTSATLENAPVGNGANAVATCVATRDTAVSSQSGSIVVLAGTPSLVGGVGNWADGAIENSGVALWVQTPSGVRLDTATAPAASGQVIFLEGENLISFAVNNPEAGEWTYGFSVQDGDIATLQLSVTTIPTGGIDEMINALGRLFGYLVEEGNDEAESKSTRSSGGWRCKVCKVASFGIALAIAMVGAAALTTLTATSAVVVLLTNCAAWITAPIAIAFLTALATGGVLVVDFILTSLCEWFGVC